MVRAAEIKSCNNHQYPCEEQQCTDVVSGMKDFDRGFKCTVTENDCSNASSLADAWKHTWQSCAFVLWKFVSLKQRRQIKTITIYLWRNVSCIEIIINESRCQMSMCTEYCIHSEWSHDWTLTRLFYILFFAFFFFTWRTYLYIVILTLLKRYCGVL